MEMSVRDGRSLRTKTIWNNKDPVFNQVLPLCSLQLFLGLQSLVRSTHMYSQPTESCCCQYLFCLATLVSPTVISVCAESHAEAVLQGERQHTCASDKAASRLECFWCFSRCCALWWTTQSTSPSQPSSRTMTCMPSPR